MNKKRKSVADWINHLPLDVKEKFLNNFDTNYRNMQFSSTYAELSDVINLAFNWSKTPEGNDYWNKIWSRADGGKYDKKPVNLEIL